MDLAVTAKPACPHGDRFDHGPVGPDPGAQRVYRRSTVPQQGDIRRRATDIAHQRIVGTRQPARPDDGGRRTAQDRFDGANPRLRAGNQRPIPPHHHQGGGDTDVAQRILGPPDKAIDHADQTGVENRCHRPLRAVELGRQLVRRRNGPPCHLVDKRRCPLFVGGIAHRELACHGETADRAAVGFQKGGQGRFVQRRGLCARMIVAPREHDIRLPPQRFPEAIRIQIPFLEPDVDQRHTPALPFDKGIGRQGRRQGSQRNIIRRNFRFGQYGPHRGPDPDGQIVARGQCLCRGDHLLLIPEQDGIGVGAPCVHSQQDRHAGNLSFMQGSRHPAVCRPSGRHPPPWGPDRKTVPTQQP